MTAFVFSCASRDTRSDKWRNRRAEFFECDEIRDDEEDEATVARAVGARGSRRRAAHSRRPCSRSRRCGWVARSVARSRGPAARSGESPRRSSRRRRIFERSARPVARGRRCPGRTGVPPRPKPPWNLESTMPRPRAMSCWSSEMSSSMPFQRALDLHAAALAELGGGGAELVARDAADRADLRRWSGFGFGRASVSGGGSRDARVARARRRDAAPVS